MTFGTETPDFTNGDLSIRPANAEALGFTKAPTAAAETGDALLDELLGLAKTELSNVVSFPVTSRPGDWILEFDAIISEPDIKRYRKGAQGTKKKVEDSDMSIGNAMPMIEKNTGIFKLIDGKRKQIMDPEGDPLLLGSDAFLNAFGKGQNAHAAVRKFLGDAETNTIGAAVLKAAGWGEDLEPLDPTEA
jgi:hypothetical protein